VERLIVGFVQDEAGDWVALLDCLHRRHVRHNPPFRSAAWVLDDARRSGRIGTSLDCPLCDRTELPPDLVVLRTTPAWDEDSMPAALRRAHRVASGTWGRLHVESGELRFRARTEPPVEVTVSAGGVQAIPPDVEHEVEPCGHALFYVEFLGRAANASA
jgi:tellurite resistance-related uncharacterized protein